MRDKSDYDVRSFTDVAIWGDRLWGFLNESEMLDKMIEASDAGRPAAEAISEDILQRFGEGVVQNRVKQFTGYLIKQVMESNGFRHDRHGITCRERRVYTRSSSYVRVNG